MEDDGQRVVMEVRETIRECGMTVRGAADAIHVAYETLRGWVYRGALPSVETTYHMAVTLRRPIRLRGPQGTVVIQVEEETKASKRPKKALPLRWGLLEGGGCHAGSRARFGHPPVSW